MSGVAIYSYLNEMINRHASDLYLTVDSPPMMRIDDVLEAIPGMPEMKETDIQSMLGEILTPHQLDEFKANKELNVAISTSKEHRFRVNVMRQRQLTAMVIRRIVSKMPSFEELRLPPILAKLVVEKRGLILVVGVTSSGKSTTLASMVDYRNKMVGGHIITIEDPIEFHHDHKKGIVSQREIGIDTASHHIALKNVLRQKPDVILVGEVRDAGVMELTVTAAETGHLCYATLHANNAAQALDRVTNLFREERRQQIRMALMMNLRAIIAQRLVPAIGGGVVPVIEIMLNEGLIRECIVHGETNKIHDIIASNTALGMMTFDQSLFEYYKEGIITEETVLAEADHSADMKIKMRQHKIGRAGKGIPEIDTSELSL